MVVVHASARKLDSALGPGITRHPQYREALIEMSVVTNAALAAHTLQREIGGATDGVRVAYGVSCSPIERSAPRCGGDEGRSTPRRRTQRPLSGSAREPANSVLLGGKSPVVLAAALEM